MIPEWSSIVDLCKKSEAHNDSLSSLPNTICTTISLSDKFLSFKSKGGEYKKVTMFANANAMTTVGRRSLEALRLQPLGKPPQCFS